MKIIKVKVSVGETVNIGNYENVRADIGMEAEIPDNKEAVDILDILRKECEQELEATILQLKSERHR